MSAAVVLIPAGGTNLNSVLAALDRLGTHTLVSSNPADVLAADRVILPGVGASAPAMERLAQLGLAGLIPTLKQPVLGICLGMQLLFERSDEGGDACLGIVPGTVGRLEESAGVRIPHMGWNRLERLNDDPLLAGAPSEAYAYFVHSYAAPVSGHTSAAALHGTRFSAVVRRDNFWGTQFHPERSGAFGAQILRNFLEVAADA